MKLIRFGAFGQEKPGVIINDNWYSVAEFITDYNESFFENNGLQKLQNIIDTKAAELPLVDKNERLGSPFARPSKIVCIGLNYAAHARETGAEPPKEPVLFFKSTTALGGPNDKIIIPKNSEKTDWEVELAVVIGKKTSYVEVEDAMDYVAGYCLHNDVSERAFQIERGGQWAKGKGCDTFAPMGPF
ncbi:MAG: FAA hydrolase family protein, partial [Sphingobacteriales bacterium]